MSFCARFVLSVSIAVASLAACGGSQPPILPQSHAIAAHADRVFSGKHRSASCPCLYVTNVNHIG